MFGETGVLNEVELHARAEVKWETYTKKVQIEARILGDLAMNHILPVASRYQSMLLDKVSKFMAIFPKEKARVLAEQDLELIEKIARHMTCIQTQVEAMVETRKVINKMGDIREKAIAYHDRIAPTFDEIRAHIDKLELIVDNEMWTLPKYRELLFLR
jgi:glutamine synthetase